MKTTLEMPDDLSCLIKAEAARNGLSLKNFVAQALREKLAARRGRKDDWRAGFGRIPPRLAREIRAIVDEEFSRVDPASWR